MVDNLRVDKGSNSVSRQGLEELHGLILSMREATLLITVLTFSQLVGTQQVLLWVELYIDKKPLMMEVDTGAAVTIVSEERFRRLQPRGQVSSSAVVLRTHTSEINLCWGRYS